jgi:hypothetical protein
MAPPGDKSRRELLAPPPWSPSFEHALSVRADSLTAPPAAPPRPCVAHRRRLGCRVGALADYFAGREREHFIAQPDGAVDDQVRTRVPAPALPRIAPRHADVPARAAASHGSTDCPRSPLVPAPNQQVAHCRRRDRPADGHRAALRDFRRRRQHARRGRAVLHALAAALAAAAAATSCSRPTGCTLPTPRRTSRPAEEAPFVMPALVGTNVLALVGTLFVGAVPVVIMCMPCQGSSALGAASPLACVWRMCMLSCRRCPACALLAPAPAPAVRC